MKIKDLIKSIALQSGVSETEIKTLLDNTTLDSIEIEDAVSTKLTAPRLSMDAAKNNPDLKKHFTALALNGIDAELERTATEHGLTAEEISELKALDSTSLRTKTLVAKVKALETAKAGAGTADTVKLNKQIEDLNNQIATERTSKVSELAAKDASLENERIDWTLNSMLSNHEYATPVDKEINILTAKTLISKSIQEKGLKIVRENNGLSLKTSEGTDYFDNNIKVGVQDFTTKVLANAKLLKASSSTPAKTTTTTTSIVEGNPIKNVASVLASFKED